MKWLPTANVCRASQACKWQKTKSSNPAALMRRRRCWMMMEVHTDRLVAYREVLQLLRRRGTLRD